MLIIIISYYNLISIGFWVYVDVTDYLEPILLALGKEIGKTHLLINTWIRGEYQIIFII